MELLHIKCSTSMPEIFFYSWWKIVNFTTFSTVTGFDRKKIHFLFSLSSLGWLWWEGVWWPAYRGGEEGCRAGSTPPDTAHSAAGTARAPGLQYNPDTCVSGIKNYTFFIIEKGKHRVNKFSLRERHEKAMSIIFIGSIRCVSQHFPIYSKTILYLTQNASTYIKHV